MVTRVSGDDRPGVASDSVAHHPVVAGSGRNQRRRFAERRPTRTDPDLEPPFVLVQRDDLAGRLSGISANSVVADAELEILLREVESPYPGPFVRSLRTGLV